MDLLEDVLAGASRGDVVVGNGDTAGGWHVYESASGGWWTADEVTEPQVGHALHLRTAPKFPGWHRSYFTRHFASPTVHCSFTIEDHDESRGDSIGFKLQYLHQDNVTSYYVMLHVDGRAQLYKESRDGIDGQNVPGITLARGEWHYLPGVRRHLQVRQADDGRITAWLDGKPLLGAYDPYFFTSGQIGLRLDGLDCRVHSLVVGDDPEAPVGYYLLDHPNPNAHGGFHGYSTRRADPRMVVLHTTESIWDLSGPDSGAENTSSYMARMERPASYHTILDRDSTVPQLPYDHTAFHVRGYNSVSIGISIAGQAARWNDLSDDEISQIMDELVPEVRKALDYANIPATRLSATEAHNGGRGITTHEDLDPTRRYDPGADFPWDVFMARLNEEDDVLNWSSWVPQEIKDWAVRNGLVNSQSDLHGPMNLERTIVVFYRFWKKFLA